MNVELAADIERINIAVNMLTVLLCAVSMGAVWVISGLLDRVKKLERESTAIRAYIAQKKLEEAVALQKSARNHPKI